METALLLKFLRHLIACTEAVLAREDIELFEVTSLRRELLELQRHLGDRKSAEPRLRAAVLNLKLEVDEGLLSDSGQSKWLYALTAVFHRSPLVKSHRSRRMEEAKRQITRFRDALDHLRFALELPE